MSKKCQARTEVYSRVVGYFRPVQQWNIGKKLEFEQRKPFNLHKSEEYSRATVAQAKT